MKRCAQALAFLLLRSNHTRLVEQIQYLQIENGILRQKLPRRITITFAERDRLLRFGKPLGPAIRHLISIVHPRTFYRWKADEGKPRPKTTRGQTADKGGRPPKPSFVRELVLRMARENDWGLTRITAEIRSLHVGPIGRTTVRNILKAGDIDTGPKRSAVPWSEFVRRHAATLWACDFLSARTWTSRGYVSLYVLIFIHVGSRRVFASPATRHPNGPWVEQQARNFAIHLEETGLPCSMVLRDRDAKFTRRFDFILRDHAGSRTKRLPPCSPNLNAYAERFVQTIKHECLNRFVICGARHFDYLVSEFVDHYHHRRPHQGIGNQTPIRSRDGPPLTGPIECDSRLGGVIKHYYRAA